MNSKLIEAVEALKAPHLEPKDDMDRKMYGVWDDAIDSAIRVIRQHEAQGVDEDLLEAVISEHDLEVPEGLLASPAGFGAHRDAMRKALSRIIPLTMHIEAEYRRSLKELRTPQPAPEADKLKVLRGRLIAEVSACLPHSDEVDKWFWEGVIKLASTPQLAPQVSAEVVEREAKVSYGDIADFIRRYGGKAPSTDSPESLDVISDFMLCLGAEAKFHVRAK